MSAFNGSGTFVISGSGLPYITGTPISSTVGNQLNTDLAAGLSTCITKDGQTVITNNIPMAGFKLTGLGAATTNGDALSYGGTAVFGNTTVANLTVAGHETITSTSANALAVGPNGTTTPTLQVDASTGTAVTGLAITGKAVGNGVTLTVISSGTNENLAITPKGSGTVSFASSVGFADSGTWGSGGLNASIIGGTTPAAGHFTTLSASSTVSGTGFSTYLASPPAIGGGSPAAGNFTALGTTGNITCGGAVTATGNVTAFSDARLKTELAVIENALEKVKALTGYTFYRTDIKQYQTGLLAQDVDKVLPQAVDGQGEWLALAYGNMMGLIVEAIKELDDKVEQLAAAAGLA